MQDKPSAEQAPLQKTTKGRRITYNTFAILGASTPRFPISTMRTRRKQKLTVGLRKTQIGAAAVSNMHNASLHDWALIGRAADAYVSLNANDGLEVHSGKLTTT
ncbi:MAG: hypothetical protein MO846_05565 [Candidatus Devosia symbiotica]|nr:hypothetical protein [Candidatus Devosia symbiotica]